MVLVWMVGDVNVLLIGCESWVELKVCMLIFELKR